MKSGWAWVLPAALVLAGCTPTAPPSTPAPTPTFMCTPEAGGAESPCSQQDYEKMKARDAQYAEAEKVYREYLDEYVRVMKAGGGTQLTAELEGLLGTQKLRELMLDRMKYYKSQGLRAVGPGITVKSAVRLTSLTLAGSVAAIRFCIDAKGMATYRGTVKQGDWGASQETIHFSSTDSGSLKITSSTVKRVKSCG